MADREISNAVIYRLPRYHRYLGDLDALGVERISSGELSKIMGVTASQIRQDLNNFGGFGQQGYGYNVKYLREQIGKIIGLDQHHRMIIAGAGSFGHVLAKFFNDQHMNFKVVGIFDVNPKIKGETIEGIEVQMMDEMPEFVKKNHPDIGILTVPSVHAMAAAQDLVEAGIKAIWNYAHIDLDVPDDVAVENVHLMDSLLRLSFNFMRNKEKHEGK